MELKTKELWKTIGFRTLQVLFIFFLNSAIWFMLISKMIEVVENISYWNAMTIDLGKLNEQAGEYYHWYNDVIVYVCIVVGLVLTYCTLKFLYKSHKEKQKLSIEKEKLDVEKEKQKKLDKIFEKTFGKD